MLGLLNDCLLNRHLKLQNLTRPQMNLLSILASAIEELLDAGHYVLFNL